MSEFQVYDLYEKLLLRVSDLEPNGDLSIVVVDGRPKCGKTTIIKRFEALIEQQKRSAESREGEDVTTPKTSPNTSPNTFESTLNTSPPNTSFQNTFVSVPNSLSFSGKISDGFSIEISCGGSDEISCNVTGKISVDQGSKRGVSREPFPKGQIVSTGRSPQGRSSGDCKFIFFVEELAGKIIETRRSNDSKREIVESLCEAFWRAVSEPRAGKTVLVFDRAFDSNLMFVNQPDFTVEQNKHEQALCSLIWVELRRRFDKVIRIVVDSTSEMINSVKRNESRSQPGDSLWNGICNVHNLPDVGHCVYIRSDFTIMNKCVISILQEMNKK